MKLQQSKRLQAANRSLAFGCVILTGPLASQASGFVHCIAASALTINLSRAALIKARPNTLRNLEELEILTLSKILR